MKRIILGALMLGCCAGTLRSQYFDHTQRPIVMPGDITGPCVPVTPRSLAFDFEPLWPDRQNLDVVLDKNIWQFDGYNNIHFLNMYGRNVSGQFPTLTQYTDWWQICNPITQLVIHKLVFGNLRPNANPPRRDLAIISSGFPHQIPIHENRLDETIHLLPYQTLMGDAVDGTWGAFTSGDVLEDLAVTDPDNTGGPQIRIYPNTPTGYLDDTPIIFDGYRADQIVLAQINGRYDVPLAYNKLDVVAVDGPDIVIWRNDNLDSLSEVTKQIIPFPFGITHPITSIAVADIDNDGYNDIIVGHTAGAGVFLNSHDANGTIHDTPDWTYSIPGEDLTRKHLVAVGDVGSRSDEGGADRNDRWNDLVIVDKIVPMTDISPRVRVFVNQRGLPPCNCLYTTSPQEIFTPNPQKDSPKDTDPGDVRQILLADLQHKGGLSLVYTLNSALAIYYFWHTGDPAPAPPINLQIRPFSQGEYTYPKITWAANTERDLAGYQISRKVTGLCGDGNWHLLDSTGASTQEYIDWTIGTVGYGSDCIAQYKLKAKDAAVTPHYSDFSTPVQIAFSSLWFKVAAGKHENIPVSYALHEAYPNPFNPTTQISFDLPADGTVSLAVFDVLGRKVADLVNEYRQAGYHTATWDASKTASGVYFVRFTVSGELGTVRFMKMSKLVLMK